MKLLRGTTICIALFGVEHALASGDSFDKSGGIFYLAAATVGCLVAGLEIGRQISEAAPSKLIFTAHVPLPNKIHKLITFTIGLLLGLIVISAFKTHS